MALIRGTRTLGNGFKASPSSRGDIFDFGLDLPIRDIIILPKFVRIFLLYYRQYTQQHQNIKNLGNYSILSKYSYNLNTDIEWIFNSKLVKTITIIYMYLTRHIVSLVLKLLQPKDSYTINSINGMEWEICR